MIPCLPLETACSSGPCVCVGGAQEPSPQACLAVFFKFPHAKEFRRVRSAAIRSSLCVSELWSLLPLTLLDVTSVANGAFGVFVTKHLAAFLLEALDFCF